MDVVMNGYRYSLVGAAPSAKAGRTRSDSVRSALMARRGSELHGQLALIDLTTEPDWWLRAACSGSTVDFFPVLSHHGAASPVALERLRREIAAAKAVCGACPVKVECLDYALDNDETHLGGAENLGGEAIWGGTTARERDNPTGLRWRRNRHG